MSFTLHADDTGIVSRPLIIIPVHTVAACLELGLKTETISLQTKGARVEQKFVRGRTAELEGGRGRAYAGERDQGVPPQ